MARGLRGLRGWGFVCTAALSALVFTASGEAATAGETISPATDIEPAARRPVYLTSAESRHPPLLVYPARTDTAKPLVVFLHGMCDAPEKECPSFAGDATRNRVLLCPRANLRCDGGGTIWSGRGEVRAALLDSFLDRATRALPAVIDRSQKPTLIGFSLGAFVALDVVQRSPGTYKNLILLGARVEPDARLLRESGVESVLFGAGDHDMTKQHMAGVAARLATKGIRSRFVGMGDVGHWFARDMDAWLTDAFAWLELPPAPATKS